LSEPRSRDDAHQAILKERSSLLRVCKSLARDAADAEDLAQQVIVAALTSETYDPTRPMGPWLKQVARNLAADRYHRATREVPVERPQKAAASPKVDSVAHEAASAWFALLGQLDARSHSVVLLRDMLDLSVRETAEVLDLTPANVKVLLHRARKRLAHATPRAPRPGDARQMHVLFDRDISGGHFDPTQLLVEGSVDATPLVSDEAWALWRTLIDAAAIAARSDPPLQARVILARMSAIDDTVGYDLDQDIADLRALQIPVALAAEGEVVASMALSRRGRVREASAAIDEALRMTDDPKVRSRAFVTTGAVHWRQGRFDEALEAYDRALEVVDEPELRRVVTHNRGLVTALAGDEKRAIAAAEASVAEHRAAGRLEHVALALNSLGIALQNFGRLEEAEATFREVIALWDTIGGPRPRDAPQINLGLVETEVGRLAEASARFSAVAERARANDNLMREAIALANLGVAERARGRFHDARRALEGAVRITAAAGLDHLGAFAGAHLSLVLAYLGEPVDAVLTSAEAVIADIEDPRMHAVLDAMRCAVRALQDDATEADVDDTLASMASLGQRAVTVRIAAAALSRARTRTGSGR
jgi:RNA polymerase sigma-70 factor (ECF subfamily)